MVDTVLADRAEQRFDETAMAAAADNQAMTASTTAPVSLACRIAQPSAAFEETDPSTPTTVRRSCSLSRSVLIVPSVTAG
jgi:hypothetical protein